MLAALIVVPLAAFGGGDPAIAVPFSVGCLLTAAAMRPRIGRGASRFLDVSLAGIVAAMLLQLVPLPAIVLGLLSPRAAEVAAAIALAPDADAPRPMSIESSSTGWAALVTAAAFAVFWVARHAFEAGAVRRVARTIAATGFAVSLLAIAQAATGGRNIYWVFPTDHEGPLPFGPFINRNHFATWAIMAAPLCFGYIAARSDAQTGGHPFASPRTRIVRMLDGRAVWLFTCAAALLAALLLTLSRSGIVALATAAAATIAVTSRRADGSRYWWFVIGAGAAAVAAGSWSDVGAIAERIAAAGVAIEGRVRIWRETLPIVRDFWVTGTGAGTYQRAMLLYQQSDRLWYFNQAHNHYLQVVAEGGVLVAAPLAIAIAAYVRRATQAVHADRSGMFWMRAGALCGLLAVALQSAWETGLTMPANGVLAAVLAAIAVHDRRGDRRDA